jgi:2-oxoacid:acceptor oxidoreductase gamma subunit (pyruvate/2-ketoisovalerate family)
MYEIRFHGRGGQGAVTAAALLSRAGFFAGKKGVQAFPLFGAERRGAPVKAFARIDDREIVVASQIYEPDYVFVFEEWLIEGSNALEGLKKSGWIVINTKKSPEEFDLGHKIATTDATGIALSNGLKVAGFPVINSSILGAFPRICSDIKLEHVTQAIKNYWPGSIGEKNALACEQAFNAKEVKE